MNKLIFLCLILAVYCTNTAQLPTYYKTLDNIAESYMTATELEKKINSQAREKYVAKLEQECKALGSKIEQLTYECNQQNSDACDLFYKTEKKYQKKLVRLAEIKFGFNFYLGLVNPHEMNRIEKLFNT